jgi:hypothetical protein
MTTSYDDNDKLYAGDDLIAFNRGNFVVRADRVNQLLGEGLVTRTGNGLYRRVPLSPSREASAIRKYMYRRWQIAA